MKLPSQLEEEIAREYCLRRKLHRPNTTVKKCVLCFLIFEFVATGLPLAFYLALDWLGGFSFFEALLAFKEQRPCLSYFVFWTITNTILFLLCLRMIMIGAVKLYQHYAPEDVRRRCICMPTCSEYTIMVIRKYGPVVGGIKAYIRLFRRCRGNIYSFDYPYKPCRHYTKRK